MPFGVFNLHYNACQWNSKSKCLCGGLFWDFFTCVSLPVKNEEDGNPYGNSGGWKKNSSKNKDGQIKKLHNMCIYIFFLRDGVSA